MGFTDFFQMASMRWDEQSLPMWGRPTCSGCDGYGWLREAEEDEDYRVTSFTGCDCCLPKSDEDHDRMQERLLFVAKQVMELDDGDYEFYQPEDLH
jgi:hypothetical protein